MNEKTIETLAAENEMLREQIKQAQHRFEFKIAELSTVREIGMSLIHVHSFKQSCQLVLSVIIRNTIAQNCSIMLLDHDENQLLLVGMIDSLNNTFALGAKEVLCREGVCSTFKPGDGAAGEAILRKHAVLIDDAKGCACFRPEYGLGAEIGSLLCVPMMLGAEPFGVLTMSHADPHVFGGSDVNLFNIIASFVAILLHGTINYERLHYSETKYRALAENSSDGIAVIQKGTHIYANPRYQEITGYSLQELKGTPFMGLLGGSPALDRIPFALNSESDCQPFEVCLRPRNEEPINVEICSSSILYSGKDAQIISVRDLTERKRSEEALRQSEERYRTLVENTPIAVYRTTPGCQGRLLMANPAFFEMFGIGPQADLTTVHLDELWSDPEESRHFSERLRANGRISGFEARLKKRDEIPFWGSVTARVEYGANGEDSYFDCMIMDITAQKKAEEEKQALQAQLVQAQRMEAIGTLAGGIAHNFNNLLMGIQGNASLMLLETDEAHQHRKMLKRIESQVQSGAKLTSQLLGYARKGKYQIRLLNLNEVVKETIDTFTSARKEIRVHLDLEQDLLGIQADQGQIEQVLLNLCVNAADAMPEGGDLFLETKNISRDDVFDKPFEPVLGRYVLLSIRDTGAGMDKKTMEHIFEPFFTTKDLGKGTGLGLASVYGIINGHGGYIHVDSTLDHGTTFTIYLPAINADVGREKELQDALYVGKGLILLVDDEDVVLEVGAEMLKKLGYEVALARGGQQALEVYKGDQERIDMVIIDMIMPGMGGGQTYDKLKELNPAAKVLLSSGYSIDGQASEILGRGCNGFIQKPFNIKNLSQKIRTILNEQ
jgi:PAS domain S-box-containing protein